jgi:hypothetical protein
MKDRWTSLFWLILSLYLGIESLRLGIGTPRRPAVGFFPFCAAGTLGILSLILFFQTFFKKDKAHIGPLFSGLPWHRVIIAVVALLAYAMVMPLIGYLISTFCLITLLVWILEPVKRKWFPWPLITSLLATGVCYYVFSVLLGCQFPAGLFNR